MPTRTMPTEPSEPTDPVEPSGPIEPTEPSPLAEPAAPSHQIGSDGAHEPTATPVAPHPQPATPRGEATRRRILDAAEAVFGALGYYEASISEITRRAGVAQGTFYIYFRTKRAIFVELIEDFGLRLRAAARTASQDAPNRLEAERRGFMAYFDFVAEHRNIYRIIQEAERVAPETAHAYYYRISEGYERGLRAAMARGEIHTAQPEAVAFALMGIGHFTSLRWLIWPRRDGTSPGPEGFPPEVLRSVLDIITRGLAPDPPSS